MRYSEAVKTDYGTNAVFSVFGGAAKETVSKEPIDFGKALQARNAAAQTAEVSGNAEDISIFSAGADAEMLGIMSQMKDGFEDELDDSISIDEIEQLDEITDIAAAEKAEGTDVDPFSGFEDLSGTETSDEMDYSNADMSEVEIDTFWDVSELV